MMKRAKNNTPAMTPDVIPMMYKASHAGIEVLRYLNDPIRMNKEAEPRNEIPKAIKTLPIILMISSLLRRFLKASSASFIYSFRIAFISLRIHRLFPSTKTFLT
jgi:hypothetical protein